MPFPPIGELPYFVTLPPHGFYWFELIEPPSGARSPDPAGPVGLGAALTPTAVPGHPPSADDATVTRRHLPPDGATGQARSDVGVMSSTVGK